MRMTRFTIRLPSLPIKDYRWLKAFARHEGVSMSEIFRR